MEQRYRTVLKPFLDPVEWNERHPQELDPELADWLQPHRSSVERLQPEWGVDGAQPILAEGGTPPPAAPQQSSSWVEAVLERAKQLLWLMLPDDKITVYSRLGFAETEPMTDDKCLL